MGSERRLWHTVRDGMGSRWKADRIENRLNSGMPDVYFTCGNNRGMLELKWTDDGIVRNFTPEQRAFFMRHQNGTFMLIGTPDGITLRDWQEALAEQGGIPIEKWDDLKLLLSVTDSRSVTPRERVNVHGFNRRSRPSQHQLTPKTAPGAGLLQQGNGSVNA